MTKGTIIYTGGFELPDKNAAAHRVLSNAKILKELGYNVVFIDVDKSISGNSRIISVKRKIQGFDCWSRNYPRSLTGWIDYLCNIEPLIEVVSRYSDIEALICYNYQAIALMKLILYCKRKKVKIISDCTEWLSTNEMNIAFKFIKKLDTSLRMCYLHRHLDGLIVISRYLEKYYSDCKNVIRIPPLVDFSEEKWKLEITTISTDNKIRLVYAGNPGKHKDKLNLLIDCFYKLKDQPNYEFKIIGITKEQYLYFYPEHINIIDKMRERIFFLGRISHVESLEYVKNADFTIFLRDNTRTTQAGFPTKFIESLSCGTPVITNFSSDLAEYMLNGINSLSIDIFDLQDQIKKILEMDRDQLVLMKKAIVSNKTFAYQRYIETFNKLFKS